eukprot:TRINITY_DN60936_c0_g1_i1.p1 TRINITY_DN60936_c0_g1~~TRINITY_DN60936_c0_g1_i1.p1  ORF type:complete len:266 (+),score=76.57 TRINITY_DN60936_c0_g1_i1:92-799(+)
MGSLCAADKAPEAERPPRQPRPGPPRRPSATQLPAPVSGVSKPPPAPLESPAAAPGAPHPGGLPRPLKQRKLCVLGKCFVGKSALCIRYVEQRFFPYYEPTINNNFTRVQNFKGDDYQLSILDANGQDECMVFEPQFSIGTHAYILVFSIVDYHSFELVNSIYERIQDCNMDDVALVLVGNKGDLAAQREVPVEEARGLAERWRCPYVECSAKDAKQVSDVFLTAMAEIVRLGVV